MLVVDELDVVVVDAALVALADELPDVEVAEDAFRLDDT